MAVERGQEQVVDHAVDVHLPTLAVLADDGFHHTVLAGHFVVDLLAVHHQQGLDDGAVEGEFVPFVVAEVPYQLVHPVVAGGGPLHLVAGGGLGLGGQAQALEQRFRRHGLERHPGEEGVVLGIGVVLVGYVTEVVDVAGADRLHQFLGVVAVLGEVLGETFEQFWVDDFVLAAEVVDRAGLVEPAAEEVAPHAAGIGLGKLVVLHEVVGQGFAAGLGATGGAQRRQLLLGSLLALLHGGEVVLQESWIAAGLGAVAAFVQHDGVRVHAGIVGQFDLVLQLHHLLHGGGVARGRVHAAARLAEEGVHPPEVRLDPFLVERVVVALGALRLQAEEQPGNS